MGVRVNVSLRQVTLDDKYTSNDGPIYLTGSQALLRLAMHQLRRDELAGRDTACFISGYRGSPMHNVDRELWRAGRFVEGERIHFQPGVNEDLAATSCWGSQQSSTFPEAKFDGVFAMWYGKGPGLDRSIDAIRHGHLAGAAAHGGVLVAVGDDPAMKSTDVPAASETMFADLIMPMLYPATVQEIIDYGLLGWEMSRFSGAWTGLKLMADTVDAAAVVAADPHRLAIVRPNFEFPWMGSVSALATIGYCRKSASGATRSRPRSPSPGPTKSIAASSTGRSAASASSPPARRRWMCARP